MGEFKPRNPDADLIYRGEKKIRDAVNRNTKAIENIDLSDINVSLETGDITDAINSAGESNASGQALIAEELEKLNTYKDLTDVLEKIYTAISELNFGEDLQEQIAEIKQQIEQIVDNALALQNQVNSDEEQFTADIVALQENVTSISNLLNNTIETVNSIIESIGNIPSNLEELLQEIQDELAEIKELIGDIPDNVGARLTAVELAVEHLEEKIEGFPDNFEEWKDELESSINTLQNEYDNINTDYMVSTAHIVSLYDLTNKSTDDVFCFSFSAEVYLGASPVTTFKNLSVTPLLYNGQNVFYPDFSIQISEAYLTEGYFLYIKGYLSFWAEDNITVTLEDVVNLYVTRNSTKLQLGLATFFEYK